jgi:hypothetical protein
MKINQIIQNCGLRKAYGLKAQKQVQIPYYDGTLDIYT